MLNNETLSSYKYMSHNVIRVTSLYQHALSLFYSVSPGADLELI